MGEGVCDVVGCSCGGSLCGACAGVRLCNARGGSLCDALFNHDVGGGCDDVVIGVVVVEFRFGFGFGFGLGFDGLVGSAASAIGFAALRCD